MVKVGVTDKLATVLGDNDELADIVGLDNIVCDTDKLADTDELADNVVLGILLCDIDELTVVVRVDENDNDRDAEEEIVKVELGVSDKVPVKLELEEAVVDMLIL